MKYSAGIFGVESFITLSVAATLYFLITFNQYWIILHLN